MILNESFTRNTRLATYDDEEFVLNFSGKVSYLENIKKFEDSSEIDDDHIFMKVKKIICKHEKIIDKMCQYCLTTLSDEELKSFRMYLFQVVNDSMIRNSFVGGKTLEQEENLFVNMVR